MLRQKPRLNIFNIIFYIIFSFMFITVIIGIVATISYNIITGQPFDNTVITNHD